MGTLYDPMVAKLVCHGPDRPSALARLHAALGQLQVGGWAQCRVTAGLTGVAICAPTCLWFTNRFMNTSQP